MSARLKQPHFYALNTHTHTHTHTHRGDYSFPSPFWDNISESAKDLVRRMLVVDPRKRLTAEQCLQHPWVQNASKQETCNFGNQHKAFLLIRRLPLFEQVRWCMFVYGCMYVCVCGNQYKAFLLIRRLPLFDQVRWCMYVYMYVYIYIYIYICIYIYTHALRER
jgi:hypothetical protein